MNNLSPNQKLRKAIDSWIMADVENFRIAKQVYFERTRIGTKGLTRADVATRLMRLGVTVRELEAAKG